MPGGRPPKYDPARMLPVVRVMAKLGATNPELARALKVSVSAIELWCRTHPEFLRATKPGKGSADERVERSLYQRATGYSYDGEELVPYDHIETRLEHDAEGKQTSKVLVREKRVLRVAVLKHVPPSDTAAIFWLLNRRKDRWKNYKHTEISTPAGKPLEFKNTAGGQTEAELIGAYHQRLAAAGLLPPAAASDPAPGAPRAPDPGVDP